jgi:voltage-gated potassium channel Kch
VKNPIWQRLLRFWEGDGGLPVILALLAVTIFVSPVVDTPAHPVAPLRDIAFSALLLAGAMTATNIRWLHMGVLAVVALSLLLRWAAFAWPSDALLVWREATTLLLFALFCGIVGTRVYRAGPVTPQRIMGAVAVYLLLGLSWAQAYELLYLLDPAAFTTSAITGPGSWTYFSFVTMTTVGYGDISPASPLARSLAISESLTGQLYLAVMLARLVALQIAPPARD